MNMTGTTRKRFAILIAGFLCGMASAALLTTPHVVGMAAVMASAAAADPSGNGQTAKAVAKRDTLVQAACAFAFSHPIA